MQRYLTHSDSIEILTWFEGVGERGHLLLSGKGGRGGEVESSTCTFMVYCRSMLNFLKFSTGIQLELLLDN